MTARWFPFRRVRRRRKAVGTARFLAQKETARALVYEIIEQYNGVYHYRVGRVTIRNQRSRWGSCSRAGNLNFNFRIIDLPRHLAEYIVVHELCHIGEFNHSRNFWELVQRTVPDWQARRDTLRLKRMK